MKEPSKESLERGRVVAERLWSTQGIEGEQKTMWVGLVKQAIAAEFDAVAREARYAEALWWASAIKKQPITIEEANAHLCDLAIAELESIDDFARDFGRAVKLIPSKEVIAPESAPRNWRDDGDKQQTWDDVEHQ